MEGFWRPKKLNTGPRRMKENTKERDKEREKPHKILISTNCPEKCGGRKAYRIQADPLEENI